MKKWRNDKRMDQDGSAGRGNTRNTKQSHPTIRVGYPKPHQPWPVVSPLHDVEPLLLSSWLRVSLICQMDAIVSRRIALLHFIRMDCLLRLCSNIVSSLTDGVSGSPLVQSFRVVPNEDCRVGGLSRWSRGTKDTNLLEHYFHSLHISNHHS
jgi:hypothetical protein